VIARSSRAMTPLRQVNPSKVRTPSPRPEVSRLDHLAPAFKLTPDPRGELLGCALNLVEIECVEALLYVRQLGDLDNAAMKQVDDLLGGAGRDQHSDPLISGEDRIGSFCERFLLDSTSARKLPS
jgi:hypothetical protein